MTSILLDPRRTVVFAGDSVTDCGRRTDPDGLGGGYVRKVYDDLGERRPTIVNAGISGHRAAKRGILVLRKPGAAKRSLVERFAERQMTGLRTNVGDVQVQRLR